jgi:hypothetical protein
MVGWCSGDVGPWAGPKVAGTMRVGAAWRGVMMQVMGTNRWSFDSNAELLMAKALEFSEMVRDKGIAELHGAWMAEDEKLMWCAWDTDDIDALQGAFDEMNRQTGLESELRPVRTFYPSIQETVAV